LSDVKKKRLVVFTGAFGTLELENDDGNLVPINLGNGDIPVPSKCKLTMLNEIVAK